MNNEEPIGYKATATADDYYQNQGLGGLEAGLLPEPEPPVDEEAEKAQQQTQQQEQEQQDRSASTRAGQIDQETGEDYDNNPLQELGTAILGSGIDLVEDIGETAQRTVQGKWFDNDFKPTWLQVDDAVEPMQTTRWGSATRGLLSFGLGFWATGGVGKIASISKIPGSTLR